MVAPAPSRRHPGAATGPRILFPFAGRALSRRAHRHALREAIAHTRYDRLVVAAGGGRAEGFRGDDIAWLLDHAPGELVIIRPAAGKPVYLGPRRGALHSEDQDAVAAPNPAGRP